MSRIPVTLATRGSSKIDTKDKENLLLYLKEKCDSAVEEMIMTLADLCDLDDEDFQEINWMVDSGQFEASKEDINDFIQKISSKKLFS